MDTSELGRYLQKYRPQELHVEGEKKKKKPSNMGSPLFWRAQATGINTIEATLDVKSMLLTKF